MNQPSIEDVRAATGEHYEVEGLHAQGGMGAVYLGRHRELGSRVAIKVLHRDLTLGPQRLARFKREAALAANLSHPHIVSVFEFATTNDLAYLVMPFVEGKTLAQYVAAQGPLEYDVVREMVTQVGAALQFAHDRGVIHRDIKPSNILREEATGRWMVTDFGVARERTSGERTLTEAGAVIGTPAYMAPEQAAGARDIDGRVDLYALAAAAHEALVGTLPNVMSDRTTAERRLRKARPELSIPAVRALTAPLALDRDQRPPSAKAWLDTISSAQRGRRIGSWLTAAVGAAALVLVGLTGWWLWQPRGPGTAVTPSVAILPFMVTTGLETIDLRAALPRAFEAQLQWVPDYRVVSADRVGDAVTARFGTTGDLDSLQDFVIGRFAVSETVWGNAAVTPGGDLTIEVQLRDAASRRVLESGRVTGPVDSLSSLVSAVVLDVFAGRAARRLTGWRQALPRGLDAFNAYYEAEELYRRGAFDRATERFDDVIRLDSTFAPAYLKRMLSELSRTQPSRVHNLRSALEAARLYRDRLDPTSAALLDAYELLAGHGDLAAAIELLEAVAVQNPQVIDAWVMLGYVQFYFAAVLGTPRVSAERAWRRVHGLDPQFVTALALLAQLAFLDGRNDDAQRFVEAYLAVDNTSVWAELVHMVDSLVFQGSGPALRVRESFPTRPAIALETIGLGAGELQQAASSRLVSTQAVRALWKRAATRADREAAFRMMLAVELGGGRDATADSLFRDAERLDVSQAELDRWILLTAVTAVAQLGDEGRQAEAARRLLDRTEDGEALWLAARWYGRRSPARYATARSRLEALATRPTADPLFQSLSGDLRAGEALARGDTATAVRLWKDAQRRYSVGRFVFGLTASLWPLRLEVARVSAVGSAPRELVAATDPFMQMAGFQDQIAWTEVLPLREHALRQLGAGTKADSVRALLIEIVRFANGARKSLRDSLTGGAP